MRFLAIIFLFITANSFSQINACFTVTPTRGCPPLTVSVIDCSTGSNTPPVYYYEGVLDDNQSSNDTFYTFTEPGSYPIFQKISTINGNDTTVRYVDVLPIPTPKVEVFNCGSNKVFIEITNVGYDEYNVNWGDGNTQILTSLNLSGEHQYPDDVSRTITISGLHQPENCGNDTIININPFQNYTKANIDTLEVLDGQSLTLKMSGNEAIPYQFSGNINYVINSKNGRFDTILSNLNTTNQVYCYQIEAINKCSASTLVASSKSDEVCSIILNGTAEEGYNQLSWNAYSGDNTPSYELIKNELPFQTFNSSQNPFNDSSIFCSQTYNYQLNVNTNSSISISNEISLTGKSKSSPNPVNDLFSTFNNDNEVVTNWESPGFEVDFYEIDNSKINDTFYIKNINQQECFEITFTDLCGNKSQISDETCPIYLDVKQNSIFELELNWNDFIKFEDGLSNYVIHIYDNSKTKIQEVDNSTSTQYIFDVTGEENQIYHFRIEGISNDSMQTFSNEVELKLNNRIMVPNAFTPNGDGDNEVFLPKVRFVKDYKMAIYDKWGANLFSTTVKTEGWTGNNFPPGIYSYYIEITDYLGETKVEKGTVTLIR